MKWGLPTNSILAYIDFKLSVDFEVGIEGLDLDRVQELAEKTHNVCPYSKAVKGNIEINTKAVEYDSLKE